MCSHRVLPCHSHVSRQPKAWFRRLGPVTLNVFPRASPAPKMTTAGLRGYLDTQKSEFLREVRTPLRFLRMKLLTRALRTRRAPRAEPPLRCRSWGRRRRPSRSSTGSTTSSRCAPRPALAVRRAAREQTEPGADGCGVFVAQPEDIAAQQAKVDRRANAHDAAKQAKIADMKVPARPRASPGDLRPLSALLGRRSG